MIDFPVLYEVKPWWWPSQSTTHYTLTSSDVFTQGQLLVTMFSCSSNPTCSTSSTGWVKLGQTSNGTSCTMAVFYKVAAGFGNDVLTIEASSSVYGTSITWVVDGGGVVTGSAATGTSDTPDSPDHDAGDSNKYLWISGVATANYYYTGHVQPTGFGNKTLCSVSGWPSTLAADMQYEDDNLNPDTWSISSSSAWVAYTIAIEPIEILVPGDHYHLHVQSDGDLIVEDHFGLKTWNAEEELTIDTYECLTALAYSIDVESTEDGSVELSWLDGRESFEFAVCTESDGETSDYGPHFVWRVGNTIYWEPWDGEGITAGDSTVMVFTYT